MDLQNYISHTPEYVKEFKNHKLNVRTYSKMGLMIVKCYRNNNYDYENHPWIRYCRGAVIDTINDKVVCVPPMKSYEEEKVNKIKWLNAFKSIWISAEVFNLLDINNTISYLWISDISGRQYAVPNYLTARQLNAKLIVNF